MLRNVKEYSSFWRFKEKERIEELSLGESKKNVLYVAKNLFEAATTLVTFGATLVEKWYAKDRYRLCITERDLINDSPINIDRANRPIAWTVGELVRRFPAFAMQIGHSA